MNATCCAAEGGPSVLAVPLDELILGSSRSSSSSGALAKFALPGHPQGARRAHRGDRGRHRARRGRARPRPTRCYEQYQAQLAEARTEAAQIRAQAQADKAAHHRGGPRRGGRGRRRRHRARRGRHRRRARVDRRVAAPRGRHAGRRPRRQGRRGVPRGRRPRPRHRRPVHRRPRGRRPRRAGALMLGSSRESLAALRASLDARRGERGLRRRLGRPARGRGRCWAGEKSLRQALADSGQPAAARAGIVTLAVRRQDLGAVAGGARRRRAAPRWSSDADLVDALEQLGAQAAFTVAEADGTLDRVEDELFRFGRAVDDSRRAADGAHRPGASTPSSKAALVRDLLGGTAAPATDRAARARGGQPARPPAGRGDRGARRARRRAAPASVLAEVRSAVAARRRAAAPGSPPPSRRLQGRQVRLNVDRRPRGRRRHRRPGRRRGHRRQRRRADSSRRAAPLTA